jgi:hypothetical protein
LDKTEEKIMESTEGKEISREELMSALFAHMVMQQANIAMMMLGKVAHPETGKTMTDLDSAKLFIDQLEMLEAKTKGNLSKEEQNLLKQSLMSLRMAFVEAANAAPAEHAEHKEEPREEKKEGANAEPAAAPPPQEESHKKFSKKY